MYSNSNVPTDTSGVCANNGVKRCQNAFGKTCSSSADCGVTCQSFRFALSFVAEHRPHVATYVSSHCASNGVCGGPGAQCNSSIDCAAGSCYYGTCTTGLVNSKCLLTTDGKSGLSCISETCQVTPTGMTHARRAAIKLADDVRRRHAEQW